MFEKEDRCFVDNIPKLMQDYNNWILCRDPEYFKDFLKSMSEEEADKFLKTPISVNGYNAKVNNPATWTDFSSAVNVLNNDEKFGFLGFVLNNASITAIDIDHCLENGQLVDAYKVDKDTKKKTLLLTVSEIKSILARCDSYTEISGSGHGLHIFIKGNNPGKNCRNKVEMYSESRYIRMTGNVFENYKSLNANQDAIDYVYENYVLKNEESCSSRNNHTGNQDATINNCDLLKAKSVVNVDRSVIDKVKVMVSNGQIGSKERRQQLKELFAGNNLLNDESRSDMSLAGGIYAAAMKTVNNDVQKAIVITDAVFRESGLMRSKWDEKRGDKTYGEMTLLKIANSYIPKEVSSINYTSLPVKPKKDMFAEDDDIVVHSWEDRIDNLNKNRDELKKVVFSKEFCYELLSLKSTNAVTLVSNYLIVTLKAHKIASDWKMCFSSYKKCYEKEQEELYLSSLTDEQKAEYIIKNNAAEQRKFPKCVDGKPIIKDIDNFKHMLKLCSYEIKYNVIKRLPEVYINGIYSSDYSLNADALYVKIMLDAIALSNDYDLSKEMVHDLLRIVYRDNQYNPAVEYFADCKAKWDKNDYFNEFINCFTFTDEFNDYLKNNKEASCYLSAIRKWFVGCVKMSANTGSAGDIVGQTMLILQSKEQNIGKSHIVAHLLPQNMCITVENFDAANKDSVYKATQAVICELAECGKSLAQVDSLKSFITEKMDVLRRPYDSSESYLPRRTNFIGTINDDKFLHDPTGNRRFVVLPIVYIDWAKFNDLKLDQFWGQIANEADNYDDVHLTREEVAEINKFNETKRVVSDVEQRFHDCTDFEINQDLWVKRTPSEIADVLYNNRPPKNAAKEVGQFLAREYEKFGIKRTRSGGQNKYTLPLIKND